ncbi:MAG: helix-turn-helix domain-containing protein [Clostridia bacterium]|nr:helix-turn-helix domain-containing protein [Clostridia bacterium]
MKKEEIRLAIMQQRIEKKWTQEKLADMLKVSQRSVSLWENGEIIPRNTTCIRLAQVFGLPLDYFLPSEDEDDSNIQLSPSETEPSAPPPEIVDAFQKLLRYYGGADKLRSQFEDEIKK